MQVRRTAGLLRRRSEVVEAASSASSLPLASGTVTRRGYMQLYKPQCRTMTVPLPQYHLYLEHGFLHMIL